MKGTPWIAVLLAACATLAGFASVFGLSGCAEPELEEVCPDFPEGAVVITEIRGVQGGANEAGQWVELYNTTNEPLELAGARLLFRDDEGEPPSSAFPGRMFIRGSLVVEPGDYVVIGSGPPNMPPETTDLGVGGDLDMGSFPSDGIVDLLSCDRLIDRVTYVDLPTSGSWALDGSLEPDASANDSSDNYCNDDRPGSSPGVAPTGTPGADNPNCADLEMEMMP